MNRYFRYLLFATSAAQIALAIAFLFQAQFAVDLWPFVGTTQMSFIFIASILAAAATSTLWCLIVREDAALVGVALDYIGIFLPITIFAFQRGASTDNDSLTLFAVVCLLTTAFGLGLLLWSVRIPPQDKRPMPRLVRLSFIVFVIALVMAAVVLIRKRPDSLPWRVTEDLSVMSGWFFMGAATYFAYGVLRPGWYNTGGQLAGFLAYDLVLIVPFLQRLPDVPDELRLSLVTYTAIVIYSGLLAAYYLFINPGTRFRRLP